MSDTASWYQRKLAQMRGPQAPYPQARPNPGMPASQGAPQVRLVQAPVQQVQAPVQQQYVQPQTYDETAKQEGASMTSLLDVQRATGVAKPGQGERLNPDPCPNCGRGLFYANLGKARRGPPPAPHCFNCGFNGLFEQGLEASWGGT